MPNSPGSPFYRLRLQGTSSRSAVPYSDIQGESYTSGYDTGYAQGVADAGPGAGAAGTLIYSSGVDGLNFGIDPVPDYKVIQFTGAGDGEFYAGRLVFSGDTAAYQITVAGGDARDTPFECDSGSDFCFAFDEGSSFSITFKTLYIDGTEQTMTVDIYDIDGSLITSITASAQIINPFIVAASGSANPLGVWSAENVPQGFYGVGATVMLDALGSADDLVVYSTDGTAQFEVTTGFGCFDNAIDLNAISGNQVAIQDDTAQTPITSGSFILIAYINPGTSVDGVYVLGRSGPGPGSMFLGVNTADFWIQDTNGTQGGAVAHGGVAGWYALSISRTSGGDWYLGVTRLVSGFTYANVGSDSRSQAGVIWGNNFIKILPFAINRIDTWRVAALAHYSSSKTPEEFALIIESIEPTLTP